MQKKNNNLFFIKYFQLNGEYTTNTENNTFRLPYMFAAMQIEQFEINTQQEKLLFIEQFTITADVCNFQLIFRKGSI